MMASFLLFLFFLQAHLLLQSLEHSSVWWDTELYFYE